jgi:hypothetical protein
LHNPWVVNFGTAAAIAVVSYFIGHINGYERGLTVGTAKAYRESLGDAKQLAQGITDSMTQVFMDRMVTERCGAKIADQENRYDTRFNDAKNKCEADVKTANNDGYKRGLQEAENVDTLTQFYLLLKKMIASAGEAADKGLPNEAILRVAQDVIATADRGRAAVGTMGKDVLDGDIGELEDAIKGGNRERILAILIRLKDTLEARDAAFKQVLELLRTQ